MGMSQLSEPSFLDSYGPSFSDQSQPWGPPPTPQPGFWDKAGEATWRGVMRGGAKAGQAITLAMSVPAMFHDWLHFRSPSDDGSATATLFKYGVQPTVDAVEHWQASEGVGTAGQISGGVGEAFIPTLLGGGVNPLPYIASQQIDGTMSRKRQGADTLTALGGGALDGIQAGLGWKFGQFAGPLPARMVVGGGGNVALGYGHDLATREWLRMRGYDDWAAQIDPANLTHRGSDFGTGLFFSLFGAPGVRPAPTRQLPPPRPPVVEPPLALPPPADNGKVGVPQEGGRVFEAVRGADGVWYVPDEPIGVTGGRLPEKSGASENAAANEPTKLAKEFAQKLGRSHALDLEGRPTYEDGTAYVADSILDFYDHHVAHFPKGDQTHMPDVMFLIGKIDDATAAELHKVLPSFHEGLRDARITARGIKHIHDSRPEIARDVLERLADGSLKANEVLPHPTKQGRALLVLHGVLRRKKTTEGYGVTVVEVSANGKGIDVVSSMTSPKTSKLLLNARHLKSQMQNGEGGSPGAEGQQSGDEP